MKVIYPACFYDEDDGGYSVVFPDLPGCITQGDSLEEAIEMAEDAALGWILTSLENGEELPNHTDIKDVKLEGKGFVNLLLLDLGRYAEKYSTRKYVKKTLTLPSWLNEIAERKGVNFSKVLQDALLAKAYK